MSEATTILPDEASLRRGQAAAPIGAMRRARPVREAARQRVAQPIHDRDEAPPRPPVSVASRVQVASGLALIVVALLMMAVLEPVWHSGHSIMPPSMQRMIAQIPGFGPWFANALAPAKPAKAATPPPSATPGLSADDYSADALIEMTPEQARDANLKIPISTVKVGAASPLMVPFTDLEARRRAVQCLTAAVYYEAGQEPEVGQRAVAQVVLNRMRHPAFPKTVCGVVFQGAQQRTGCQFTFTCDGSLRRIPNPVIWRRSQAIAEAALNGWVERSVGTATHYHANYVVPRWAYTLVKTQVLGAHIFYRWQGGWGVPAAFNGAWAGQEPLVPGLPAIEASEPVLQTAYVPAEIPVVAIPAVHTPAPAPAEAAPLAAPVIQTPEPAAAATPPPTPVLIAPAPGTKPEPKTPPKPGVRPRLAVPSTW